MLLYFFAVNVIGQGYVDFFETFSILLCSFKDTTKLYIENLPMSVQ